MSPRPTPPPTSGQHLAIGLAPSRPAADTRALHQLHHALAPQEQPAAVLPGRHLEQVTAELAPLLALFTHQAAGPYGRTRLDDAVGGYEHAVLTYCGALAGAALGEVHGQVTATAGEALLHGLALARRRLPEPSVYVSEHAHDHSVRACELLGMNTIRIPARGDGTMDPDALRQQTRLRRGAGALVLATCGTPLNGASDDITQLRAAAAGSGPVHIHVDAAAGGLAAAHTDLAVPWSLAHGAHSLTLSGHPLLGLPLPAGISLVRRVPDQPSAHLPDPAPGPPTAACPSALGTLLLWSRLRCLGRAGVAALVARSQDTAAYALTRFEAAGAAPQHLPGSLAVTFERPAPWVADKWDLYCRGDRARITTAGPLTHTAVDELAADLRAARQTAA
ncbi:pyridoxal-dependent decarboxylase [Streptomyces sp. NPDC001941]|uniref:pyridoxal-dependent decarboxylase n=1 Tax=Streptomyces sp. NPDC001941 TaxID=3154659 RepID=UPI0033236914